ncbi:aldo/keto reductase [Gulosibacter faecalis]|uniref:Aldo/keto reductase n=1 Tax=Gulosibacter faecalis TaxID=272240 RepID=A0ABW5UWC3_9MICO|nr:aldo/keto reductase [Gulosibacter faecalis]
MTQHDSIAQQPSITLNNGIELPALGFGVFQSSPEDTQAAVETALRTGYRLIDTAAIYGNEREVGAGLAAAGLPRDHVFVTTKLWISDYEDAQTGFDASLRRLGTDYVDLYLLHWPGPREFERAEQAWASLEKILESGRARAIGVCNFTPADLDRLAERAEIVPALNQVELHPYFSQPELRAYDADKGIVTQAWSPLGGADRYGQKNDTGRDIFSDPAIVAAAEAHGKTPAQVVLRWHLQVGTAAIPKSVTPERIVANFNVFDFELSGAEIEAINALDTGARGGADPATFDTTTVTSVIDNS